MRKSYSTGKKKGHGVPHRRASGSVSGHSSAKKRERPPTTSRARARADKQVEERRALYKKMLAIIPKMDTWQNGLCMLLSCLSGPYIEELPELMKQRPRKYGAYWWDSSDWKPRRKALRAAIALCDAALGARKAATKERVRPSSANRATASLKRTGHGPARQRPTNKKP